MWIGKRESELNITEKGGLVGEDFPEKWCRSQFFFNFFGVGLNFFRPKIMNVP